MTREFSEAIVVGMTRLGKAVLAGGPPDDVGPPPEVAEEYYAASDAVKELAVALARSQPAEQGQEANGWRTIDSAPKDGRRIMAYWPYWCSEPFVAYYSGASGGWEGDRCASSVHADTFPERQPTHWQPLPPPPKEVG